MPRNSSGIYTRPANSDNPPVSGQSIIPTDFDASQADIATELTNSLDRLGRGPMQAVLPMGGFKISNVGTGTASTDAATLGDLSNFLPAGAIVDFGMPTAPTGWLVCDGSAVSRITYANLFTAIGTTWGAGDGSTTFNLPAERGKFRRTWDNGAGIDPGRVFASEESTGVLVPGSPPLIKDIAVQTCIKT